MHEHLGTLACLFRGEACGNVDYHEGDVNRSIYVSTLLPLTQVTIADAPADASPSAAVGIQILD